MPTDNERLRETVENAAKVAEKYCVSVDCGGPAGETEDLTRKDLYRRIYDLAAETADQLAFELDSPMYDWRQAVETLESSKAYNDSSDFGKRPEIPQRLHLRAIYGGIAEHEGLIDWSSIPDPASTEGKKGADPVQVLLLEDIDRGDFYYHRLIERVSEGMAEKASTPG